MDYSNKLLEKLRTYLKGFRKWVFIMSLLAISTTLVSLGVIRSVDYATIMSSVGSAFMAANMLEHFMEGKGDGKS